jgi:FixJ family two-component response regulator
MSRKVLVLDDDDDMRESLAALIDLLGGRCLGARSFGALLEQRPAVLCCDLAILDINLGHGVPSGIDAYHWLDREGFPGGVIFLTGHARSHPLVEQAGRVRNARLLDKPIGMAQLRQILS